MKKLTPVAISALQNALAYAYWYKNDLKSFLKRTLSDKLIVSRLDWNTSKRDVVIQLIEHLEEQPDGTNELLRLCDGICELTDFSHLFSEDDGVAKAQRAKDAISQLKHLVTPRKEEIEQARIKQEKRSESERQKQQFKNRQQILDEMRQRYLELLQDDTKSQSRGYELEKIMHQLFELSDLHPKASFRITGEQVDGAFVLDNTHFLFEAKWHNKPIEKIELVSFEDKVIGKLENTLGLFLSINGFSENSLSAFQSRQEKRLILMDGADLMAVLEQRISLGKLITRKKEIAATRGIIYVNAYHILSGER